MDYKYNQTRGRTTGEAYENLVMDCFKKGILESKGRKLGGKEREEQLLALKFGQVIIENPLLIPRRSKKFPFKEISLEEYKKQLFSPDKGGFDYTYGERANEDYQIDKVIKGLKENPRKKTYVIEIGRPYDLDLESPPCKRLIQVDYDINQESLGIITYFRDWAAFDGSLGNMFALSELLDYINKEVGKNFELGPLVLDYGVVAIRESILPAAVEAFYKDLKKMDEFKGKSTNYIIEQLKKRSLKDLKTQLFP